MFDVVAACLVGIVLGVRDREAGPAVRAVRERVAAIFGVEDLGEARRTGGEVGGNRGAALSCDVGTVVDEPPVSELRASLGVEL
jgi:hypothetical protein